jgi:hypothetical protein
MLRFFKQLKSSIIDWCLSPTTVKIGVLHAHLSPRQCQVFTPEGELKFIEQTLPTDIFVKTPTGYSKVKHTSKTVRYEVWKLQTTSHALECADDHIVITSSGEEVLCKDLIPGHHALSTDTGIEPVISVRKLGIPAEHMYDLTLDDAHHVYYTNGILSHNSWIAGAYLLWYAMFHDDQTVLILSNKNVNAMEMIHRVRFIYERLPHWIKPGLPADGWNKHDVGFDNNSRIISQATTAESGRGFGVSLMFLDEFAFVPENIAQEFWGSVSPTIASGGKCIICSTPNGDINQFAQLWRGANIPAEAGSTVGVNGFAPLEIAWNDPPGRDKKFMDAEIAKIGATRWKQEYECLRGEERVTVQLPSTEVVTVTIEELCELLANYNEAPQ